MLPSDLLSLFIAFSYVAIVIAIAETLRRAFNFPVDFTRKFVHVGIGMSAFAVTIIFRAWYIALIGPLVFILMNYLSYRYQIFRGIETGHWGQLGTIYFPLSFAILIPLLWSQPSLLAASLMPMTWGDSFAAILGGRFGSHKFAIFNHTRSVEGSLAMFVVSFVAIFAALTIFAFPFRWCLILALPTAVVATIAEMFSPWGIDNLAVPLASAFVLVMLSSIIGK